MKGEVAVPNLMLIHDLTNPETGRTTKEDNLAIPHSIPVGTLVEIVPWDEESEREFGGVRVFVAEHTRDCDGTPLYTLSVRNPLHTPRPHLLRMEHGFSEEAVREAS